MLIQPLFWEYDPGIAARTAPDSIDVGSTAAYVNNPGSTGVDGVLVVSICSFNWE